jgi:AcrR family transcriptional regulator
MFHPDSNNSAPNNRSTPGIKRREGYAQATQQAVVDAARRLFSQRGYFSTKVDDIAALARVAPATVYAVSRGKHGLLTSLVRIWATAPIIPTTLDRIEVMDDPPAIVRLLANARRRTREEFGDLLRVLRTTAPHDEAVSESLQAATAQCRQAFTPVAHRLSALGALRDGMNVKQAVDVFWFYFGYSGLFTLHDENGWSYDRAEQWLCEEASRALLQISDFQTGIDFARSQDRTRRTRSYD